MKIFLDDRPWEVLSFVGLLKFAVGSLVVITAVWVVVGAVASTLTLAADFITWIFG